MSLAYIYYVVLNVGPNHENRVTVASDVQPLALPDSVKLRSVVCPDNLCERVLLPPRLLHMLFPAAVDFRLEMNVRIVNALRDYFPILIAERLKFAQIPRAYIRLAGISALRRRSHSAVLVCRGRFRFTNIVGNHLRRLRTAGRKKRSENGFNSMILSILLVICIEHLHHISLLWLQLLLQESRQVYLANEAYSLRVLFAR